uniref:NADH dehydrogenase subunit 2 n=1 Tax=Tanaisia sp. SS-2020 TaxID=2780549 RepID=A0A894JKE3_9TREM|nr:NADH dehydrogenase subunit 2 [Tanaisia sp. SS-2020]
MRSGLIVAVSVFSMSLFSVCVVCSSGLFQIWLFLELLSLSVVPLFFISPHSLVLSGLFSYLVVSGIASCVFLVGVLFESCIYFSLLGLLLKFGVFPFYMWVYGVVSSSNWCVIWALSTYLKVPVFVVYYLFGGDSVVCLVECLGFLGLLLFSLFFWFSSVDLYRCWCHMMLSSTVVMVVVSFASFNVLWPLFLFYVVWASLVVACLWCCSKFKGFGSWHAFLVCGVVLAFPVSLSVVYKVFSSYCLFSCSLPVFLAWVVYGVSEQLYFLSLIVNHDLVRSGSSLLRSV